MIVVKIIYKLYFPLLQSDVLSASFIRFLLFKKKRYLLIFLVHFSSTFISFTLGRLLLLPLYLSIILLDNIIVIPFSSHSLSYSLSCCTFFLYPSHSLSCYAYIFSLFFLYCPFLTVFYIFSLLRLVFSFISVFMSDSGDNILGIGFQ